MAKGTGLVLYTRPMCADCQQAKAYLNDLNIAYEQKNVEDNQQVEAELVTVTGSKIVPAFVFYKKGLFGNSKVAQTFIGFDANKQA
ncbi:MAG: glutaredoxin family protein, partial [Bacillota bacterium]